MLKKCRQGSGKKPIVRNEIKPAQIHKKLGVLLLEPSLLTPVAEIIRRPDISSDPKGDSKKMFRIGSLPALGTLGEPQPDPVFPGHRAKQLHRILAYKGYVFFSVNRDMI